MTNVDTEKYLEFVKGVTSDASLDWPVLAARMSELEVTYDCNVTQLLTAALGLAAESGEFTEIVKKIILQGKPLLSMELNTSQVEAHFLGFQNSKIPIGKRLKV